MKKSVIILAFALGLTGVNAQTETNSSNNYNKWSIEFAGGVNKPQKPFSDGYFTSTPSPWVGDLGVRYMFNNKFGLKADFGYNSFKGKSNSLDFDSKYYRVDLQAVANLGRIMNFETWTNTIGLLGHAGFGYSQLRNDNFRGADEMGNFIAGVTGQIKLSNRLALTGDFSTIFNASQDRSFDGAYLPENRGYSGLIFNGTVGLTVYLGKNTKHADWTVVSENVDLSAYDNKIADLENRIKNMPEKQVIVEKPVTNNVVNERDVVKDLINDKYYSVYFDFNKATPIENSTAAIDVVLSYLRKNPSASLDIIGYADQVGKADYNEKLSNARAENVKKILTQAGIASSRLNVVAAGSDTSIQKDSDEARRLARRVTFKVK
ncbi:OmpA family protein [Flavobacterium sp. WLB]|uniref:OmpA family protein n=1 Tax=unclassified Flavobacterium TaxID=196869 RepID=UPI0006AB9998|nr:MULTISPECIES: OmpA family protein [unclassified Flavobacterium]KOP37082.1 flagellar motor protein MotB [Flavobacterium sp. VMW]OWU89448.1 flagellar motor protein MotB [Flavobacterium sp. NLM]PUU69403.1 OmpA family protein [Flavobacterium sp. WLB]